MTHVLHRQLKRTYPAAVLGRGIMLREAGIGEMWGEVAALTAFVVVVMGAAAMRFRKTLD